MLSNALMRRVRLLAITAFLAFLLVAPPAEASTDDARAACGASVIVNESAFVPRSVRKEIFLKLTTARSRVRLMCGDGRTWGAVHIELKHEVPNWAEASTCIERTISRGRESEGDDGRLRYSARINQVSMFAVRGVNGLITAYPTGSEVGIRALWSTCGGN